MHFPCAGDQAMHVNSAICLVPERHPNKAGAFYPRVIRGHKFLLSGNIFQRYGNCVFATSGDHDATDAFIDQACAGGTQACGQQSICCGRCAAALQVAKNAGAGFEAGQLFQLVC